MKVGRDFTRRRVIPAAFLLFMVYLAYLTFDLKKISCQVCVEFQGQTSCRTASGPTRQEAIRTATENACGQLASGMGQTRLCAQTPPVSVDCASN
jgi:hypothetical protein